MASKGSFVWVFPGADPEIGLECEQFIRRRREPGGEVDVSWEGKAMLLGYTVQPDI